MAEQRKISPVIILAAGAGIAAAAAAGIYALARAAPPEEEIPPDLANLYGKVTDAETGDPTEGVKVTIDGLVTYTDASGRYAFEGLGPGSYTITFEKDGYEPATSDIILDEGNNELNVEMVPLVLFAYVGAIRRHWLSDHYDYFTVDVQNVGSVPRSCTLEFWTNHKKRSVGYRYTGWELVATVSHTLQPGEVKTFGDESCRCYVTGRDSWVMWYVEFRGPPGVIAGYGKHWE